MLYTLRMRRPHVLLLAALAFAAPLLIFASSVARDPFVSIDDGLLITKNIAVHELTPKSVAYVFSSYDPELYIPLTLVTYQIVYAIAGPQPVPFHLLNL